MPTPSTSRPPLIWSRHATCLASTTGSRMGSTTTPVMSLMREVRAATYVSINEWLVEARRFVEHLADIGHRAVVVVDQHRVEAQLLQLERDAQNASWSANRIG